jgi:hypothetical protein
VHRHFTPAFCALVLAACATSARSGFVGGSSDGPGGSSSGGSGPLNPGTTTLDVDGSSSPPPATTTCPNGQHTTISGIVYDPAGQVALYDAVVYVPVAGAALPAVPEGVTCDKCSGAQATGVAVALSDSSGHFVLQDTPAGANVPLVIQIGKWRRQTTVPSVTACQDNPLTDVNLTRLPRNQSEGHLPQIAVSTGHSDALECLLRKIGIDDTEFTTDSGNGRVHMYVGCVGSDGVSFGADKFAANLGGASFPSATTLFASTTKLASYDVVILSCEGHKCPDIQTDANGANLKAFADEGGRIFLDHLHFNWLNHTGIRSWEDAVDINGVGTDLADPFTVNVDTSFPKGMALSQWLVATGASTTAGDLVIHGGQFSINKTVPPYSQQWIHTSDMVTIDGTDTGDPAVEYLTINTPVEDAVGDAGAQCGRMVYTDLHVSAGPTSDSSHDDTPFPGGCVTTGLSPQEKALEFMLFDLASCVQQESVPPMPPPPVPR